MLERSGHVAVTWNNATLIWGGLGMKPMEPSRVIDPSVVHIHFNGKWMEKNTTGDTPTESVNASANVMDGKMFVVGGFRYPERVRSENCIYVLDLVTWLWEKLNPNGNTPHCIGSEPSCPLKSWPYKGKIYVYSCYCRMKLMCYNTSTNDWEYPIVSGQKPSIYLNPSIIIRDDTIFLFGGFTEIMDGSGSLQTVNDLYILNMKSMRWELVHGSNPHNAIPCARSDHSLTLISQSAAVLYGGHNQSDETLGDCWILDLDKARPGLQDPSTIWTRLNQPQLQPRAYHSAVIDSVSQRLWLIGGSNAPLIWGGLGNELIGPEKITVSAVPLKILAAECAAKRICKDDPRTQPDQFPKSLSAVMEACRSNEEM